MTGGVDSRLSVWQIYYELVGSAGAALIGIQFVVITLIASLRKSASADTIHAFGTPTVVHFASALLISAIMSAPWPSLLGVAAALLICGVGGLIYGAVVVRRARRQTGYKPVWEDWLWYATLPCLIHFALILAALALFLLNVNQLALFVIGASTLGLLLIGVHNAWDAVTHIVSTDAKGDPAA